MHTSDALEKNKICLQTAISLIKIKEIKQYMIETIEDVKIEKIDGCNTKYTKNKTEAALSNNKALIFLFSTSPNLL